VTTHVPGPSLLWRLRYARLIGARLLLLMPLFFHRLLGLVTIVAVVRCVSTWDTVSGPQPPAQAVYQWVIQLIIAIVAALISAALAPKPKEPEKQKANVPSVEDGKGILEIHGEVWIEDEIVLGWREMGTIKIKQQGGKK